MKLKYIYGWIVGKKNAFINSFGDDMPELRQQAEKFWSQLDSSTWLFLLAFILIAVILACIYYKPYNDMPGRHYRPSHWCAFGVIAMVVSLVVTVLMAYFLAPPKPEGSFFILLKIGFANLIYTGLIYFLISVLFCNNVFGKINAYKIFFISNKKSDKS